MLFETPELKYIGKFNLNCRIVKLEVKGGLNEQFLTNIKEHHLHIDYPLSKDLVFKQKLDKSCNYSIKELLDMYVVAYKYIYCMEHKTKTTNNVRNPKSLCLNREHTDGEYGIWGHYIEDLHFEDIVLFINVSENILYSFVCIGS